MKMFISLSKIGFLNNDFFKNDNDIDLESQSTNDFAGNKVGKNKGVVFKLVFK